MATVRGDESTPVQLRHVMISGFVSGVVFSVLSSPVDRIKILMQMSFNDANSGIIHKNTIQCAKYVLKHQGISSLYHGYITNLYKEAGGGFFWFSAYFVAKSLWQKYISKDNQVGYVGMLFAGACAGLTAWFIIYPLDVLKSRMFAETNPQNPKYKGFIHCLTLSIREEGYAWCYKGLSATLSRAVVVGAIMLTANDSLSTWFKSFI